MADTKNKRKFDDGGSNVSYNRVPPPLSDFEQARQKAMQIAARLSAGVLDHEGNSQSSPIGETRSRRKFDDCGPVSSLSAFELAKQKAEQLAARFTGQDTKRSHIEDADNYDQSDNKFSQVNTGQFSQSKRQETFSSDYGSGSYYNMHGPPESRKVEIPNAKVGLVIGKGGETIKGIQMQSGARVQITKDMDHNPNLPYRTVELMGTPEQIKRAEEAIQEVIAEADAAAANSSHNPYPSFGEQMQLTVPTNKVGLIIGRGGETIKSLQSKTGARIQLVPVVGPPEHQTAVAERVLTLMGTKEQVDAASEQIKELISENRVRGPPMQVGYNQGYNPPQGPPQWGTAGGPPQPQGYGYQQGPYYPGPPQHYGSFPPPPPAAWGQPPPPPPPPHFPPAGTYGYYNQPGQMVYHSAGYEQQTPYAEQPPGASQELYGQQAYGHQIYGMPPPGANATNHSQGHAHVGYGLPGVGQPAYGQDDLQQGPPGVGQGDNENAENRGEQDYEHNVAENEKPSSEDGYDEATKTSYEYGQLGLDRQGQEIAGQANYGQAGTGYWDYSSGQYVYGSYEASQSGYGDQVPQQSAYGEPTSGGKEAVNPAYSYHGSGYHSHATAQPGQEEDGNLDDSPEGEHEKKTPKAVDHLAYENGNSYNNQIERSGEPGQSGPVNEPDTHS